MNKSFLRAHPLTTTLSDQDRERIIQKLRTDTVPTTEELAVLEDLVFDGIAEKLSTHPPADELQ